MTRKRENDSKGRAPRKPYKAPRLTEYGHIAKLTAGQTGTHSDKSAMNPKAGMG